MDEEEEEKTEEEEETGNGANDEGETRRGKDEWRNERRKEKRK